MSKITKRILKKIIENIKKKKCFYGKSTQNIFLTFR